MGRRLIKRSSNMGYKGMQKLSQQASRNIESRGGLGGGSSVQGLHDNDELGTVSTAKNAQMNNNSNPFIGDSYFQNNPSKVLGEQYIEHGKWGNEIIKVKGDFSAIQQIDAVPVQVVDFYPTEVYTDETRAEVIQQVFTEENKAQNTKAIKEIRTRGKKKDVPAAAGNRVPQEIYSFREVGKMYNDNISVDEMDAYYFTHPELNYKLLFDDYTNDKNSLIEKGLICYEDGKWVYFFTYISGNVNKKISNLQKDKEKTISAIGQAQYDRQMKMLMDVRPKAKGFVGDDKIILLPHSNFAKEIEITELRSGKPELNGSTTLFYAFKKWLRVQPPDMFKKSNYREVIDFYLDNKSLEVSKDLKGKEKEKAEKNAINIKQRTKEEGDALFAQFLAEELTPDDQAKVSYLWNEKFNSIVEPDLSKIPICLEMAKTWKNNAPFRLNNTQRQAVAFMMEKKSGLLAYGVGVGKGHLLTSDILTPDGFVKMGDIKIGDNVVGADGNPTKVKGVYPLGKIQCYEVVFSDGSSTKVSKDHLWKVQKINNRDNKNGLWHVLETEKLIEHGLYTGRGDYYYTIPMVSPINFNERELKVHPYLLGVLIGDGSMSNGTVGFSNMEPDIIQKVRTLVPDSVKVVMSHSKNYDGKDWRISRKSENGGNELTTAIKELGLCVKSNAKFIPNDYLFNTFENRLELLRGLLDTDGYLGDSPYKKKSGKKGCTIIYTTVSEKLANDLVFLVQTFGGNATIKTKLPTFTYKGDKKTGQLAYNITIRLPKDIIPVSSVKQLAKFQPKTKYQPVRFIADIVDIGEHEAQCIEVEAEDHLYVCEECIVTHNTQSAIMSFGQAYYNALAKRGIMVVPTNTYPNWLGEIQGYVDKESGKFMQGTMPQLPPVVGIFNLNPQIVKDTLKVYSAQDEATLFSIMQAIELLKTYKDELSGARKMEISKVYDLNWNGLMGEYEFMMENSERKTVTSFPEFVIKYLTTEYNYKIYELGVIKSFPDGTIFVTTEVGLQRLGVSEENKSDLVSTMFTILSQGEKSNDDQRDSEKKIAALQLKIEQTVSSSMKNAKLNLEDLGIDWACFDEAHYYKKLFTFVKGSITEDAADSWNGKTKREKSKYELKSGSVPSSRALSAFVLSHYIQQKNDNRNVVMLTATPFTNSPLEVFSMLTLTNYKELEDLGLSNMTDFFDTFMKINYDIKYTPQKTVVKDIVLTGYNNLPQLRQIIYSLMDKKDAGANLIRPDKHIWPSLERGIETTLPMTLEQSELMKTVKDYINGNNEYEQICRSAIVDEITNTDFDGFDDDTLIAEWERNTGKEYTGDRDGLSDSVRDNLVKQIKATHEEGVEMEEGDLDEAESLGVRILRGLSMMRQITLSPYLYYKACRKAINEAAVLPDAEDYVTTSPKLMYVAGCVKSVIDYHRERDEKISGQVIYMNAGVEYFILIKQYLAKFCNIKESQIGIVSGQMSKNAKENVKRQFLNGDIIILIGSSTISVGVNLQDNATTLYNCYYDWNPTDAAQIEGRIWRQGNRFANVRIVYPQCYNSADPVIFEYLNSKTLRINEIWNRSSELQELDLRDFNPKELQKKLITDPEEKADWEILKETDEISSKIIYFENRRELLTTALSSYRQYKQMKPEVINILNRMSAKKMELAKKEAVNAQKEKIAKIVDEFSEDTEKMAKEISNYKKTRYDHENDPEGKYKSTDYNTVDSERIYNDCSKYIDILSDMDYRDDDQWGDIYREHSQLERVLTNFRYNFKDMRASEYKVLQPMGLSFDTAENPIADFNAKLEELNAQLQGIEASKPERIERIKLELASQEHTMKTVPERIAEFASYNQAMLSKYLIAPVAEKPHELPAPTEALMLDQSQAEALKEMGAIPSEDMVPVVPVEEEVIETPLEELERYAEIAKNFDLFKRFVISSPNSFWLGKEMDAVPGDKEANEKKLKDFYNAQRKIIKGRRAERKADVARITAEANVDNIERLALQADEDMQERISETEQPSYSYAGVPNAHVVGDTLSLPFDTHDDEDVAVMEMEPPVEPEVINEPAPEPASVSEVMESSRENILNEIKDLSLALKYADAEEKRNIKEAIAALKVSLKYI